VAKGSLAIDGVSLTVASLKETILQVAIIPETWERTLIGSYRPGDAVNIEVDVVGKYVETLLKGR
jgi:riboflavin synthase